MASGSTSVSIEDAIDQGRAGRGRETPDKWVRIRAQVLRELSQGLTRARVGGSMGVSSQRVTQLAEEACDAVLRSGMSARVADEACSATWMRWCENRGDSLACERLRAPGPVPMIPGRQ